MRSNSGQESTFMQFGQNPFAQPLTVQQVPNNS